MKTIAIITARGGSKRIPRKNIKEFCGKPILAYSIEAAKAAGIPIRVGVNSGSLEKEILEKNGGPTAAGLAESALRNKINANPIKISRVFIFIMIPPCGFARR